MAENTKTLIGRLRGCVTRNNHDGAFIADIDAVAFEAAAVLASHEARIAELEGALEALAQSMRDLHRYHTHNSVVGTEVWAELECEKHFARADAALHTEGE